MITLPKLIKTMLAIGALLASASYSSAAYALPTECRQQANQFCLGSEDANGNPLTMGGPGWDECITEATQLLAACITPPDGGGSYCYINGLYVRC